MTTDKQKRAVRYCENWLKDVKFKGDINNFNEVSNFLSKHLDAAKDIALDAWCEYYVRYGY